LPMDRPQGQDDKQDDTTQDDATQDDTVEDETARDDTGRDQSANPLANLGSTERPVRELNVLDENLRDLGQATSEMAHMMRKGDTEGIPSLLATVHLAVRGLRADVQDIREEIRNRFG
jgi:hypothetical protein